MEQALQSVSEHALHYHRHVPRPDRHRAELVAATGRLLRRQGYSGTSVSDFLDAGGATNGSLYHHFPGGKEELASAAIDVAAEQVEAALRSAFDATDDPVVAECARLGIASHRGPVDDVLTRFLGALDAHPADAVIRFTARMGGVA